MNAAYNLFAALFAAACLVVTTWVAWKLVCWREGITEAIEEAVEVFLT